MKQARLIQATSFLEAYRAILTVTELRSRPLDQLKFGESVELRQRLENANDHFRRKAGDVLNDEVALEPPVRPV